MNISNRLRESQDPKTISPSIQKLQIHTWYDWYLCCRVYMQAIAIYTL